MGITRRYSHSISGEFYTNNIDNFQAVLKKKKKKKKKNPCISCCQVPYVLNEIRRLSILIYCVIVKYVYS